MQHRRGGGSTTEHDPDEATHARLSNRFQGSHAAGGATLLKSLFCAKKNRQSVHEESETAAPTAARQHDAADFVREYDSYTKKISTVLWKSAGLALVMLAGLFSLPWFFELSQSGVSTRLHLARIPTGVALSGFSILAALSVAMQVAVRLPSNTQLLEPQENARRMFLVDFSRMLVLATFLFALYQSARGITEPGEIDVLRVIGPGIVGLFIAIVAADAGIAAGPEFSSLENQAASREYRRESLEAAFRKVIVEEGKVSSIRRGWNIVLLATNPIVVSFAFWAFSREHNFSALLVLTGVSVCAAALTYFLIALIYEYTVIRDWVSLGGSLLVSILGGVLIGLSGVLDVLIRMSEQTSARNLAIFLLFVACVVTVSALLGTHSLRSGSDGSSNRALLSYVKWRITERIAKLAPVDPKPAASQKWNRLAIVALATSLVFPLGLIFGSLALTQLAASRALGTKPEDGEKGRGLAISALWVSAILVLATLTTAIILVVVFIDF